MSKVTASIVEEMESELLDKLDDRENKLNRGYEDATTIFKLVFVFITKALKWAYVACTISMVLLLGSILVEEPIATSDASEVTLPLPTKTESGEILPILSRDNELNAVPLPDTFECKQGKSESKQFNFTDFYYFYSGFTVLMFLYYFFLVLAKLINFTPFDSRLKQEREIHARTQFANDVSEIVEEVLIRHNLIKGD